jgi:hypothetical protein
MAIGETMKAILVATLIIFLSGCTTYDVKRDSEGIVSVKVKSTRSFEAPDLHYVREGSDVSFDFSAASVDNNTEAFTGMFQGMMQMMMEMMQRMAVPVE